MAITSEYVDVSAANRESRPQPEIK